MIIDLYLVFQFIRRLATPFKEWKAYEEGIIDERGNILKSRKKLTTMREKEAFGLFDLMILNLKRLIEKLPGGQTRLASYAAALFLIKEGKDYTEDMPNELLEKKLYEQMYYLNESDLNLNIEEVIANTSAGGNIAGAPPDKPVVFKKAQSQILRRNKKKKKEK